MSSYDEQTLMSHIIIIKKGKGNFWHFCFHLKSYFEKVLKGWSKFPYPQFATFFLRPLRPQLACKKLWIVRFFWAISLTQVYWHFLRICFNTYLPPPAPPYITSRLLRPMIKPKKKNYCVVCEWNFEIFASISPFFFLVNFL